MHEFEMCKYGWNSMLYLVLDNKTKGAWQGNVDWLVGECALYSFAIKQGPI